MLGPGQSDPVTDSELPQVFIIQLEFAKEKIQYTLLIAQVTLSAKSPSAGKLRFSLDHGTALDMSMEPFYLQDLIIQRTVLVIPSETYT